VHARHANDHCVVKQINVRRRIGVKAYDTIVLRQSEVIRVHVTQHCTPFTGCRRSQERATLSKLTDVSRNVRVKHNNVHICVVSLIAVWIALRLEINKDAQLIIALLNISVQSWSKSLYELDAKCRSHIGDWMHTGSYYFALSSETRRLF